MGESGGTVPRRQQISWKQSVRKGDIGFEAWEVRPQVQKYDARQRHTLRQGLCDAVQFVKRNKPAMRSRRTLRQNSLDSGFFPICLS